ncbi:kinase-like domain-containing protein [Lanmaoa asiatica]|nr:kinase-like domain-containing protein [Lanmaoa asiatica]
MAGSPYNICSVLPRFLRCDTLTSPPSSRNQPCPPLGPYLMEAHPPHMNNGGSSPSLSAGVRTESGPSRVQNHSSLRCTPFCSHSDILIGNCVSPPLSSPRSCGHDVPPANHSLRCKPLSSSCDTTNPAAPARLGPCKTALTSVEPESLLLSYGDESFPPIHDSPSSTTCLPNPMSDNLCSTNYSPRFPPGHYLNPAFARAYSLGDELGSGGYGFVMTALDRRLKSEVAVKFVIKEKVPEQAWINHDTLGRIPTEIMLLRIINHENIVKCLDVFEDDLFFYVVQELHGYPWRKREKSHSAHYSSPEMSTPYLSSSTPLLSPAASEFSVAESEPDTPPQVCSQLSPINLRLPDSPSDDDVLHDISVLKKEPSVSLEVTKSRYSRRPSHDLFECIEQTKHKRLSEKQARYIMAQVVEAVFYLDSHGICHRDIKDENLVIDKNFKVKLIDFGSATMVDPAQARPFYNLFFGTTAYAASEVLLKQPYQAPPVEIWTLGVLMSYLLTGMSPFPTERDAIEGHIMLSELPGRKLSNSCLHLISRCLEPEPSLRADIEEVRNHPWLRGALDGL